MEFYKLYGNGDNLPIYVIIENGKITSYNEKMVLKKYTKFENSFRLPQSMSKYTLVTDENELAKLMLIYET